MGQATLPPVPLGSELYDSGYFESDRCEGWEDFRSGRGLSALKRRELERLAPGPGLRVLDAGCGRGEVLLACSQRGAEVAGIDYSEAAVAIARETLAVVAGADVRRGDVTALPWPDDAFDRALFADVIEHLDPDQADAGLCELRRVLRPQGRLLVHTAPNALFLRLGWPPARLALRALGRGESVRAMDGWIAESKRYHVNEQSLYRLRRALRRAGFTPVHAWIDPDVVRSGNHHLTQGLDGGGPLGTAARLAGSRPLRVLLGNDLYATGVA